jgi:hypothetical protein
MQLHNLKEIEGYLTANLNSFAVHELVLCIFLLIVALFIRLCHHEVRKQNDVRYIIIG